jgi:ADP-ribose pyrophosphatase
MFPKKLDRKVIYKSNFINLYVDKVLLPSGKIIEKYHQLDYPKDSVSVLILNQKNEVCFIKSLRYTTQKVEWEIPAGQVEKGENIIEAARREALEETGFKVESLKLVYLYNPANGMSNQNVHIVFGKVIDNENIKFDKDEVQEIFWLSKAEIKDLILNKEIADGISLLSILLYLNNIFSQ